jgi:hypothetical protein
MKDKQYEDDINSETDSLSSGSISYVTLQNTASSYKILAQEVIHAINDDPRSRDIESESFSSNIAQVDEAEAHEDMNDDSCEQYFDSQASITERLDMIVPIHELDIYEAEGMNQACNCACHQWSFDDERVGLQYWENLTPLERWNDHDQSDTSTVFLRLERNSILPCQNCTFHDTMGRSTNPDEDSSDEEGV